MEVLDPTVRAILKDVVIRDDGAQFIDNFADWVIRLRSLPRKQASRVFVQLSVVARQFLDAGSEPVAASMAVLARIGLPSPKHRTTSEPEGMLLVRRDTP